MHQLKVLILGPASFTATLNELEPFLKFNSVKDKNSSDFDVILFHEEALRDKNDKKIICNSNSLKVFASNNKTGDIIEGKIKNITDFGIFVGLTEELDGLIHASDISWDKPGEEAIKDFKIDQDVKFKILDIDVEKERVSLGIKQLLKDVPKQDNKLSGKTVTGVITKIDTDKIYVKFNEDNIGFVKKSNLAKLKTEQNTARFAVEEKIDAKVIKKSAKDDLYELSIKDLEIQEEKEALKEYGSSSSGASIGDIIGAALEEDKTKPSKSKDEKK